MIRQFFEDEIIYINETCVFSLNLDTFPLTKDAEIYMDIELMFAEMEN
jgi:hypothetical protein